MCSKEKNQNLRGEVSPDYSEITNGEYSKEMLLTQESTGNSVFLKISSEKKEFVDDFLSNHELSLTNEIVDIDNLISENQENNFIEDTFNLDTKNEKIISIEVVASNMNNYEKNFSIDIRSIENKSEEFKNKSFQSGTIYIIRWEAESKFIGIVNHIDNYNFFARKAFKKSFWHRWDIGIYSQISNVSGSLYPYFSWACLPVDYQKVAIDVWPDNRSGRYRQSHYKVVHYVSEFRGQVCTNVIPASFDYRNCYVGTPPSNTHAFIYPNNTGNFYYSPVNGNQCPMEGSHFDGANCFVYKVPSGTKGFVYDNKWYVLPELLLPNPTTPCY